MKSLQILFTFLFIFNGLIAVENKVKPVSVEDSFKYLLVAHEKAISAFLQDASCSCDEFDKLFFTDFSFFGNQRTKGFFQNIQANLESGNVPRNAGTMMISYTSYTNINGKTTGVSYQYRSDGKNIQLIKGTLNNGQMLRAVYNYDVRGKLMNTQEFIGDKLIHNDSHRIEI